MIPRNYFTTLAILLGVAFSALSANAQDVIKVEKKAETSKDAIRRIIADAQEEYRLFFTEPKTVKDFWAALSYEVRVGKFEVAAYHIDKILKMPPEEVAKELVEIEEAEGMSNILKLRMVKQWSKHPELEAEARKNVETFIDRVLDAVKARLGDAGQLTRFIQGLSDPVPEVRGYSLYQLRRSKEFAAPLLAEALRTSKGAEQEILKRALLDLDAAVMPPLLELYRARNAKDAADAQFRMNLLWLAKMRMEKRVAPYLWHMTASPDYPKGVRDEAKDTLAYLLNTSPERLPAAKVALTELAEKYYRYQIRFPDTIEVADRDNPAKLTPMSGYRKWFVAEDGRIEAKPEMQRPDLARFDFGIRYAFQALDLDKGYLPAQALYLAFILEADFTGKPYDGRLDKLVTEKRPAALQRLLAKIDFELLTTVLERAADEQNYAVMLPLIDALGERGEIRAAQQASGGAPGVLVRLLYYPDRRVQYAAARALLKLPTSQIPVASTRIVDVLRRFLAAEAAPKVLIIYARDERANQLRTAAREAGYESDVAVNVKEALTMLHRSADYDAIILNDAMPVSEMPFVLNQLRTDSEAGRLPLLLVASQARQAEMAALARRTRNGFVLPEVWATKGADLKRELEDAIKFAMSPEPLRKAPEEQQPWLTYQVRLAKGQAVSELEKKRFAREALDWFSQMARGELTGYDLTPAKSALVQALNNEETAVQALRIIARYPTGETQQRLAGVLFDKTKANVHVLAAQELNRHIQRNGVMLNADQTNVIRQMEQQLDLPAALRVELATVVGTLRTTRQATGTRLLQYGPEPEPAAAAK